MEIKKFKQEIEALQWAGKWNHDIFQGIEKRYPGVHLKILFQDRLQIKYEIFSDEQIVNVGDYIIFGEDRMYHETKNEFLARYKVVPPPNFITGNEPAYPTGMYGQQETPGITLLHYFMANVIDMPWDVTIETAKKMGVKYDQITTDVIADVRARYRFIQAVGMINALNDETGK
jgi:hypothetical protein